MAVWIVILNTWNASHDNAEKTVDRCAALLRACEKPGSGVSEEGVEDARAALSNAQACLASLDALAVKLGFTTEV